MSLRQPKYCACCAKSSLCPKSKVTSVLQNETLTLSKRHPSSPSSAPATKMTSENTAHSDPHLAESSAPTTRMQKCPMSCAAHADRRSRLQSAPHVPHLPHNIDITQKWARRSSKIRPSEERSPRQSFVRACAPEMHMVA